MSSSVCACNDASVTLVLPSKEVYPQKAKLKWGNWFAIVLTLRQKVLCSTKILVLHQCRVAFRRTD